MTRRDFRHCSNVAWMILALAVPAKANPPCVDQDSPASIDDIVDRIERERLKYVFVGERHGIGPAKRFVVDLVNRLVESRKNTGLYVEGFRTDCAPRDPTCGSLAWIFNSQAFSALLDYSQAPVHALDPPERNARATLMATTIGQGTETIRVALVGNSHVVFADHPEAEYLVWGGAVRYSNPGDLVEVFPRTESLTLALEIVENLEVPYALQVGGCRADYRLLVAPTTAY